MLTVLFGEVGIGKSTLGKKLSKDTGVKFIEGDDFLPKNLDRQLAKGIPLTATDVDEFVIDNLIPGIQKEYSKSGTLIVAQALYFKKHRDLINATFGVKNVRFVWLPVANILTQIGRLKNRTRSLFWVINAILSKFWFEKPKNSSIFEVTKEEDVLTLRNKLITDKANDAII